MLKTKTKPETKRFFSARELKVDQQVRIRGGNKAGQLFTIKTIFQGGTFAGYTDRNEYLSGLSVLDVEPI